MFSVSVNDKKVCEMIKWQNGGRLHPLPCCGGGSGLVAGCAPGAATAARACKLIYLHLANETVIIDTLIYVDYHV